MTAPVLTDNQAALKTNLRQWQPATWDDYLALRDDSNPEKVRLFFNEGWLWIDMGAEGINHAGVSDLFTSLLFLWAIYTPGQKFTSLGRCQLEKTGKKAAAPDLVLYIGDGVPSWEPGEPRFINLERWRHPDLVGEISDTTLAADLDEKKRLYAELQIPEYWVVNVRGLQVLAFQLQETGNYQECSSSKALSGLPICLLEQTLERLNSETNTEAASWFSQQIANLKT